MFNPVTVTTAAVNLLLNHLRTISGELWDSDLQTTLPPPEGEYVANITILIGAANGELDSTDPETVGIVQTALDEVMTLLFTTPAGSCALIPAKFWTQPGIGQVTNAVLAWLGQEPNDLSKRLEIAF